MSTVRPTALVTGASGGIGLELAREFARGGHDLVLVARSEDRLTEIASELEEAHSIAARALPIDLSSQNAAPELFEAVKETGTTVEALVNNAGFAMFGPFAKDDIVTQNEMMQLNMLTLTGITRLFLPGMIERRRGRILNVASTASFQPGPLMAVYYATKAYVLSLSEALAEELRGTGVTVTALCPGPTSSGFQGRAAMEDSKLVKGRRLATTADVAGAGYRACMAGKRVLVPGWKNNMLAQSVRLSPRALTPMMVKRVQERA
jgi:short-subunit dehydrogenase